MSFFRKLFKSKATKAKPNAKSTAVAAPPPRTVDPRLQCFLDTDGFIPFAPNQSFDAINWSIYFGKHPAIRSGNTNLYSISAKKEVYCDTLVVKGRLNTGWHFTATVKVKVPCNPDERDRSIPCNPDERDRSVPYNDTSDIKCTYHGTLYMGCKREQAFQCNLYRR